jgi:hypothetical protein
MQGTGYAADMPMVRTIPYVPDTEQDSPLGFSPSLPTLAEWWQTLRLSSDPALNFGGRLTYEQNASPGQDTCYFAGSFYPPVPSLSGGAWWVLQNSDFGIDYHGDTTTDWVVYYRAQGRIPCQVVFYQNMYIDSTVSEPVLYTTTPNELLYEVDGGMVCSSKAPANGTLQEQCSYY